MSQHGQRPTKNQKKSAIAFRLSTWKMFSWTGEWPKTHIPLATESAPGWRRGTAPPRQAKFDVRWSSADKKKPITVPTASSEPRDCCYGQTLVLATYESFGTPQLICIGEIMPWYGSRSIRLPIVGALSFGSWHFQNWWVSFFDGSPRVTISTDFEK